MGLILFISSIFILILTYVLVIKQKSLKFNDSFYNRNKYEVFKIGYVFILIIEIFICIIFAYDNFYYIKHKKPYIKISYGITDGNILKKTYKKCYKRIFDLPKCKTVDIKYILLDDIQEKSL